MAETEDTSADVPAVVSEPRLIVTHEGASAFPVDDPFVRLVFTYGSFLPGADGYYVGAEALLKQFIEAVFEAGCVHPELTLQYAAWVRDPRLGKGNRSQPPWVLAVLAGIKECVDHPRFAELVARCMVRPDDALYLVQAAALFLGDNRFPAALLTGIARGLDALTDYQLTKYANTALDLLPQKKEKRSERVLPSPQQRGGKALVRVTTEVTEQAKPQARTLRLVDVLGICKRDLSPRLFALYRYLHAPTRQQAELLPLLEAQLPLFGKQKELRQHPPRSVAEVQAWVSQALEARMTMEQMFSATGLEMGQRQLLHKLLESAEPAPAKKKAKGKKGKAEEASQEEPAEREKPGLRKLQMEVLADVRQRDALHQKIRSALWKELVQARVPGEQDPEQRVPLIGDVAFLRNVRGMYQAGIPVKTLIAEAQRRHFAGIWPFQLLSTARAFEHGKRRADFQAQPCPEALPVLDVIFERVALESLPRNANGTRYRLLGLADVSGSMSARLGSKFSSATCMDAALAFTAAFSYTSSDRLAGTWDDTFHPVVGQKDESPLELIRRITRSGGMGGGGTQIFGSMLHLMTWLVEHPNVRPPEVLVVLSDMQFHPPDTITPQQKKLLPVRYQRLLDQPGFRRMPPLAAAIVLYREVLGQEVSLVLWNLASYEGAPVPSGMDRVLLLSGFDANSFRSIEQWLRAGSPGSVMPTDPQGAPASSGQSNSSFEAVLAAVRRY
jgi:hypothetical protein